MLLFLRYLRFRQYNMHIYRELRVSAHILSRSGRSFKNPDGSVVRLHLSRFLNKVSIEIPMLIVQKYLQQGQLKQMMRNCCIEHIAYIR